MGLDLTLLPVDLDHQPNMMCSHTILNLDRNQIVRDIGEVAKIAALPIPMPLGCYVARQENGERGYGDETHDPYGDPLRYVLAKHLKPIGEKYGPTVPTKDGYQSPLNRAVMAYVCALPDDFKIVLYWH